MADEVTQPSIEVPQSVPRGIFDCDDAYRTPSKADYERLFSSAIIALDTNVLINLYRSNERTRKDTFAVLNQLREQIWIPHQVLAEFWRNRDLPSVRGHHKSKAREACSALDKTSRSTKDALDRWLKDVHLANDDEANRYISASTQSIVKILTELKQFIETQAKRDALEGTSSTHTDPVLQQLDPLLYGRVGDPFSDKDYATALSEAARRAKVEIPPGYKDFQSDKSPEQAAGDYLIWEQLLIEAERRKQEVLLVTGDVKEDWWVSGGSQGSARPRTELRIELKKRAGVELYMLTPSQLLTEADRVFGLKVDERSVSDLATNENPALQIRIPIKLAREIPACLQRAHNRVSQAVSTAGSNLPSYGSTIAMVVRDELRDAVQGMGGHSVTLGPTRHPVINGYLLYPFRYSHHPASIDHALAYLNANGSLRTLFRDLTGSQEEYPLTEIPRVSTEIPGLLGVPVEDLEIILIPYTSDVEHGVHAAYWATLRIDSNGKFHWEFIEPLFEASEI
ncbi:PIN-like domain-containing protein [Streptomyces hirsutus]|uniref:PIN-like domain-containing protein n=1 Tax=Streptomyces hirsutus TaxID=35620 RepID=UPI003333F9D4